MKTYSFALTILIFLFSCESKSPIQGDKVISNVNIVDVVNGTILPNRFVLIENDIIKAISEQELAMNDSLIVIDGNGKYLIPGLWDMHTHYNWNYEFASSLIVANGITGIREMWGDMKAVNKIRSISQEVGFVAPDIYSAGNIIDGTPPIWDGSAGVENAEEALKEVNSQVEQGVDFLKVYSLLSPEAYYAIAERSKELNIPFAGHVPMSISMWDAIDAKQQSTEHLYGLLDACSSKPQELAEYRGTKRFGPEVLNFLIDNFDRQKFDSLATILAQSDTWLSPTLVVLKSIANLDDTTLSNDPRMEFMPEYIHEMWDPSNDFRFKNAGNEYYEVSRRKFRLELSLIGDLEQAGVKFIAGTDYPNPYCYPGFSLHDELQLMVDGGMSAASALKTATYNPVLFMGKQNEFGTIDQGKKASLVLLKSNPLEDISNTKEIEAVFLRGRYFSTNDLDSMMQEVKKISSKTRSPF